MTKLSRMQYRALLDVVGGGFGGLAGNPAKPLREIQAADDWRRI